MPMNPRLLRPLDTAFNPRKISGLALWLDGADASSLYTTDAGPVTAVSSPLDISGCQLWLDASDATTIDATSGEVTEWRDKSTAGSVWTRVSGANGPATNSATMGGKNAILFDGVNDSLSASAPLNTSMPLTMFVVQRIVAQTSFGMTYTAGTSTGHFDIRQESNSGGIQVVANTANVTATAATGSRIGLNDVLSMTFPATGSNSIFLNGAAVPLGAGNFTNPILTGTHYIGRRSDGFYANVQVAEIIAYSTLLSSSDRASVEAYLAAKWGISGVHAPATATSDPVGYWGDKSGNNRHATQAMAGSRPTLGLCRTLATLCETSRE